MATAQVRVPEARIPEWMGFDGLVQLISVDGQRTVGCPYWELVADVGCRRSCATSTATWRSSAASMPRPWRCSGRASSALWAPLLGQEAAQVGSARALRPDDFVFPSYREHGVAYCRGVDPVAMLRLWRGAGLSGWDPAALRHRHARHRRRRPRRSTPPATRSGITLDGATSAAAGLLR